jgi:hypothetical protein
MSQPLAWDGELVGGIISAYDPLPTTGGADAAYGEVGSLFLEAGEFGNWQNLELWLSRELKQRAGGEPVDNRAVRRLSKQLARLHRCYRTRLARENARRTSGG